MLVNPAPDGPAIDVELGGLFMLAQPVGGGPVAENGVPTGTLNFQAVSSVSLPSYAAAVLLPMPPD